MKGKIMGAEDWRIDASHGLHIVDGDRPVATFHDPQDARVALGCVQRVNGSARALDPAVAGMRRPEPPIADWPLIIREVIEQGHPFYGTDVDEALRDYALAVQNAVNGYKRKIELAESQSAETARDSLRVKAVAILVHNAGNKKTMERHAVHAALTSPEWRIANPDA